MAKLKIKQVGNETEVYIDDEPILLHRLLKMNLDMPAGERRILTLVYQVDDVSIETDNVEVEVLNKE